MKKKIVIAEMAPLNKRLWLLRYQGKNGYVSTTWTGADHFSSKAEAEYYADNHYNNKLTTNIEYNKRSA